jgi:hypothetical protein
MGAAGSKPGEVSASTTSQTLEPITDNEKLLVEIKSMSNGLNTFKTSLDDLLSTEAGKATKVIQDEIKKYNDENENKIIINNQLLEQINFGHSQIIIQDKQEEVNKIVNTIFSTDTTGKYGNLKNETSQILQKIYQSKSREEYFEKKYVQMNILLLVVLNNVNNNVMSSISEIIKTNVERDAFTQQSLQKIREAVNSGQSLVTNDVLTNVDSIIGALQSNMSKISETQKNTLNELLTKIQPNVNREKEELIRKITDKIGVLKGLSINNAQFGNLINVLERSLEEYSKDTNNVILRQPILVAAKALQSYNPLHTQVQGSQLTETFKGQPNILGDDNKTKQIYLITSEIVNLINGKEIKQGGKRTTIKKRGGFVRGSSSFPTSEYILPSQN